MFFDGTLQAGIASSMQQEKHVVCLVVSDNEESAEWESSFLQEAEVRIIV